MLKVQRVGVEPTARLAVLCRFRFRPAHRSKALFRVKLQVEARGLKFGSVARDGVHHNRRIEEREASLRAFIPLFHPDDTPASRNERCQRSHRS